MGKIKFRMSEIHHRPDPSYSVNKTIDAVTFHATILVLLFLALSFPVVSPFAETQASFISFKPDMVVPYLIEKIPVIDCRAVRGFLGTPVDGSIQSWGYRGAMVEYPDTGKEGYDAGAGVDYSYNDNDGLHIRLFDDNGFDAVILRGGAHTRLYVDEDSLVEPKDLTMLYEFDGGGHTETAYFSKRIHSDMVSFYGTEHGMLSDIGFYRIESVKITGKSYEAWIPTQDTVQLEKPTSEFASDSIYLAMNEKYTETNRTVVRIEGKKSKGSPIGFTKNRAMHFLSDPYKKESGLAGVLLDMNVSCEKDAFTGTVTIQDPLNPRLDLMYLEFRGEGSGRYRLNLDIPDQVIFERARLWITMEFSQNLTISGPNGGAPQFLLNFIPKKQALAEAFEYRKFLMRSFFCILSEARQWGFYKKQPREELFNKIRFGKIYSELFMTLDQCHTLNPADETVRQYREWVYLRNLDELSEISSPPEPPEGVPLWAWYPRLAWLEVRKINQWWLDNRLVPTGEFGGMVGDDSDFYQQAADLPFFETDGVAGRMKDGAARLAELADKENLRDGINILVSDALHAYEEGINHLALMPRWFYGDPVYYERCMESARNMKKLTVLTDDGRRHFRHTRTLGYDQIIHPSEPTIEGRSAPLMWHTTLQAADYNRLPRSLETIQEWANTWLGFMNPGQYASGVEVLSGKVVRSDKKRPLFDRGQAMSFLWLYTLTGNTRYVEPLLSGFRKQELIYPSGINLGELYCLGALDEFDPNIIDKIAENDPAVMLYVNGDYEPIMEAIIGKPKPNSSAIASLHDAIRWPDMYSSAEQFTDRLYYRNLMSYASVCYLGGYCGRGKFNPMMAVSWEGFGTDYGALVLENRRSRLKVVVYSYADAPMEGTMRVWALEHGKYVISTGTDINGDFTIDRQASMESRELAKADAVKLVLSPRAVTVVDIEQVEKLDPIFKRADLAIAARETAVEGDRLSGVVHNIGSCDADDVIVSVIDCRGKDLVRKSLGALKAPIDLVAQRLPFTLGLPGKAEKGWKLVIDPENSIPEIYEGNNSVALDDLPAVDYSKGWE